MQLESETNWEAIASFAQMFEVERRGSDIILYRKGGSLQDGWVTFRGELTNIPFRPWVLLLRAQESDPFAVRRLMWAAFKSQSGLDDFSAIDEEAEVEQTP